MKAIWIGLVVMLAGCAGLESPDPASPYYAYSSGWVVHLNRPLTIEPGAATVRLQYGGIVPRNSVQEHDPFCVVELDTVRAEPQTLQPGRFEVWRVTRSISSITAVAQSPLTKALYIIDDDGGPTFLYFITEFRLRDPGQPNLRGMVPGQNRIAGGESQSARSA